MPQNIPLTLLSDEDSRENAYHLFVASGEDGEIEYFLDTQATEGELEYTMPFPATADTFIRNSLKQIELNTGIKFTKSKLLRINSFSCST